MKSLAMTVAFAIGLSALVIAQSTSHPQEHGFFQLADMKWIDGPPSLPKGAKLALLEGNPTQEGPFTMRLQLPDGFKIPPHWHPAVEHVTVVSGTFNLGLGDKFDTSSGRALSAGSFAFMQPGMKHFAWATGETVVQVHGIGPWKINYVNPADDPRTKP
jgi:quercetin dioxygenase-like cupin family protein